MRLLEEALSAIQSVESVEEMLALEKKIFSVYGFSAFAYLDVRAMPMSGESIPFFQTSLNKDLVRTYIDENYITSDPAVLRGSVSNAPFTWADCPEYHEWCQPRRGLKPRSFQVMKTAFDYGYRQGYIIPVHAVDTQGRRSSALITLFWSDREALFGTPETLPPSLRLIALYYHERLLQLRGLSLSSSAFVEMPALTDRERECLCWSCRGKTCTESAAILGITERTVNYHLGQCDEEAWGQQQVSRHRGCDPAWPDRTVTRARGITGSTTAPAGPRYSRK
ncbi:DNA-binding CsgD family transcriptional regulator [uncultured Gammaproteobacteria bacterium]